MKRIKNRIFKSKLIQGIKYNLTVTKLKLKNKMWNLKYDLSNKKSKKINLDLIKDLISESENDDDIIVNEELSDNDINLDDTRDMEIEENNEKVISPIDFNEEVVNENNEEKNEIIVKEELKENADKQPDELKENEKKEQDELSYKIDNVNNIMNNYKKQNEKYYFDKELYFTRNKFNKIKEILKDSSLTTHERNLYIDELNKVSEDLKKLSSQKVILESGREVSIEESKKIEKNIIKDETIRNLVSEIKRLDLLKKALLGNLLLEEFNYDLLLSRNNDSNKDNVNERNSINDNIKNYRNLLLQIDNNKEKCNNYLKELKGNINIQNEKKTYCDMSKSELIQEAKKNKISKYSRKTKKELVNELGNISLLENKKIDLFLEKVRLENKKKVDKSKRLLNEDEFNNMVNSSLLDIERVKERKEEIDQMNALKVYSKIRK